MAAAGGWRGEHRLPSALLRGGAPDQPRPGDVAELRGGDTEAMAQDRTRRVLALQFSTAGGLAQLSKAHNWGRALSLGLERERVQGHLGGVPWASGSGSEDGGPERHPELSGLPRGERLDLQAPEGAGPVDGLIRTRVFRELFRVPLASCSPSGAHM